MTKSSAPTLATRPTFSPSGVRTIIPSRITAFLLAAPKQKQEAYRPRSILWDELADAVPDATVDPIADAAVEAEGRHHGAVERVVRHRVRHGEQADEQPRLLHVDEVDDPIVARVRHGVGQRDDHAGVDGAAGALAEDRDLAVAHRRMARDVEHG